MYYQFKITAILEQNASIQCQVKIIVISPLKSICLKWFSQVQSHTFFDPTTYHISKNVNFVNHLLESRNLLSIYLASCCVIIKRTKYVNFDVLCEPLTKIFCISSPGDGQKLNFTVTIDGLKLDSTLMSVCLFLYISGLG